MWPFSGGDRIGTRGEKLAAATLKRAGCRILARNYRCPAGEADLVAWDGQTIVFAEVKTRSDDRYLAPQSAVDADKRRRYHRVARYYLQRAGLHEQPVRFDIVAIILPPNGPPKVNHIRDAFA